MNKEMFLLFISTIYICTSTSWNSPLILKQARKEGNSDFMVCFGWGAGGRIAALSTYKPRRDVVSKW